MNTNRKDVNDYFKYLKLYYRNLAKKKKKEYEEKKKKKEEINRIRRKKEEEFYATKKLLEKNIKKKNRRKVKVAIKLHINPEKKDKDDLKKANVTEEIMPKKESSTSIKTVNKKEEKQDEFEDLKKEIDNVIKKGEKKEKSKDSDNKKIEPKKEEKNKDEKDLENQKKEEAKKNIKVAIDEKKLDNNEKPKDLKEENKELKIEDKNKQDLNQPNKKELDKKELDKKELDKKEPDKKEPDKKEPDKKEPDKKEPDKKEPDEKELDEKEPDEKELDEKELDEKELDEKELDEKEPNKKEPDEKEPDEKEPSKEDIIEKELEIGRQDFIETLSKKIKDDKSSLRELELENHRIHKELENTSDIEEINKLMNRLEQNMENINGIIGRINNIENENIMNEVFAMSKNKPKELDTYIDYLKKDKSLYKKEIFNNINGQINYKNDINEIKKNTEYQKQEIIEKQELVNDKTDTKEQEEKDLENFKKKRFEFENKILKFQISIGNLDSKIKNIAAEEKISKKFFLGDMEIKNKLQLTTLAMKMINNPNNNLSLPELYKKLQSQLTVKTVSKFVPSGDYKSALLNEKNNLFNTKGDLNKTLEEIRILKTEYKNEFQNYYNSSEYFKFLADIEKVEFKLNSQKEKANLLDSQIDKSIIENEKRVEEINKLNDPNLENDNEKNKNNNKKNKKQENNNQPRQQVQQQTQFQSYPFPYPYPYQYNSFEEQELEEPRRGRSR